MIINFKDDRLQEYWKNNDFPDIADPDSIGSAFNAPLIAS
jgi:hypothetical protein